MLAKRIIPVLLLKNRNLIHITNFDREKEIYVGDPINVINIFPKCCLKFLNTKTNKKG